MRQALLTPPSLPRRSRRPGLFSIFRASVFRLPGRGLASAASAPLGARILSFIAPGLLSGFAFSLFRSPGTRFSARKKYPDLRYYSIFFFLRDDYAIFSIFGN